MFSIGLIRKKYCETSVKGVSSPYSSFPPTILTSFSLLTSVRRKKNIAARYVQKCININLRYATVTGNSSTPYNQSESGTEQRSGIKEMLPEGPCTAVRRTLTGSVFLAIVFTGLCEFVNNFYCFHAPTVFG